MNSLVRSMLRNLWVVRLQAFAYRPPARDWFRGGVATQRTANPRTGVRFPPEPPLSAGPKNRFTDLRREVIAPPVRFDFSSRSQNRPKVLVDQFF